MCEQTLPCGKQEKWLPYGLVCVGTKRGHFSGVRQSPEEAVCSRTAGGPYPIPAQRQLLLAKPSATTGLELQGILPYTSH